MRALIDILTLEHDEHAAERAAELLVELSEDGYQPDLVRARELLGHR